MQTAVEGRFDRAAILPQGNGVALFGVDLLVGVRDVAGDEFCQRQGILPRRGIAAQQRVEAEMVADFWMPNRSWPGCDVDDPSARVLSNYGASGQ